MDKAIRFARDLWYFCKRNKDWRDKFYEKAGPLIEHLSTVPKFQSIFYGDMVAETLYDFLSEQIFENRETFSDKDAIELLDIIFKTLENNMMPHWFTIPLSRARLSKTISFGSYFLIAGDKSEKVRTVSQLVEIDETKIESQLDHVARFVEEEFFGRPLLTFPMIRQFSFITSRSQHYALWAIYSVKAIYWGYVHTPTKSYEGGDARTVGVKDPNSFGIHSQINFWREVFRFDAEVRLDLDWLMEKEYSGKLNDLLNLNLNLAKNRLEFRFLTGLRFFGKALASERTMDYFDGYGVTFTFLMIAAETMLFERSQQISSRLIVLLPALAKPPHFTVAECAQAIKDGYHWRSNYVHDGREVFLSYNWNQERDEIEYGPEQKTLTILKTMVGRLLSDAPIHIKNMTARRRNARDQLDKIWFDYLDEIWEAKIGLRDLPIENQESLV